MMEMYVSNDLHRPSDFRPPFSQVIREPYSSETHRDYSRIVHSMAFRRLEGKMQLFPTTESPACRNRLTHSLEVADIALRITEKFNQTIDDPKLKIDPSIVSTAALVHDLGHPPFGHSGEVALNKFMRTHGSFEGNAQSFRTITRLENRLIGPMSRQASLVEVLKDPLGLNLTLRTIAACVKYDRVIARNSSANHPPKGIYKEDEPMLQMLRHNIVRGRDKSVKLYTVECAIMDIADDIAYSTHDLEDCMITGLTNPLDLMAIDPELARIISKDVNVKLTKELGYRAADAIHPDEVAVVFYYLFNGIIKPAESRSDFARSATRLTHYVASTYREARRMAEDPLFRRRLVERMIERAISSVTLELNTDPDQGPAFSKVDIGTEHRIIIEMLKRYNFYTVIQSREQKIINEQAQIIIEQVCDSLYKPENFNMLPHFTQEKIKHVQKYGDEYYDVAEQAFKKHECDPAELRDRTLKRAICDYVASLTDRDAIKLHGQLRLGDHGSIFAA